MNIIVNGKRYEHITTNITRKAKIEESENSGENLDGSLFSDVKGTRLTYVLTIDSAFKDQKALMQLWDDIIIPRQNGIQITMPYNDTDISFFAKVTEVEQGYVTTYNDKRIWDKIQVSFQSTTLNIEV